jgi:predicted dehydrogenase
MVASRTSERKKSSKPKKSARAPSASARSEGAGVARANARKVRYAVVGQGHISQVAVLPAFQHAGGNSVLSALVSDDPRKLKTLGRRYGVDRLYSYDQYSECLASGEIDAVYIALPNNLHAEYAVRAARAGVHVLCEKPMAVTEEECEAMIRAAAQKGVKLMVAYRLHFEEANLRAIDIVESGKIGEPKIFHSAFTMQVADGNIRLDRRLGGGTLYDIGVYCINAARYLFRDEPVEVQASWTGQRGSVEEAASATLRFPHDRIASFVCSFGAADVSSYRVIGTKGDLRVEPAYEYAAPLKHFLTVQGKTQEREFAARDQFAPELLYFSDCILNDKDPEPSGEEGLADVRIIRALYRSAELGMALKLLTVGRQRRPVSRQEIHRPPVRKPNVVHAQAPSGRD